MKVVEDIVLSCPCREIQRLEARIKRYKADLEWCKKNPDRDYEVKTMRMLTADEYALHKLVKR